jgi:hypothetical protein
MRWLRRPQAPVPDEGLEARAGPGVLRRVLLAPGSRRPRASVVLAVVLALAVIGALGTQRLLGRPAAPSAGSALTTARVTRQDLASRERVGGSLGYQSPYEVLNQYRPALSAAQAKQLQDAVASAQTAHDDAVAQADTTNQVDAATVAGDQSQLSQDQQKFNADGCVGKPGTSACAADQQAINSDQAKLARDQGQQQEDQVSGRARVDQAQTSLTQAEDAQAAQSPPGTTGGGGQPSGAVVTWLPAQGAAVGQGQTLYAMDGQPIPLFYGDQPLGRELSQGMSGHDVLELQQNLVAIGYGGGLAADGNFTGATAAAVSRWQQALGAPVTGSVGPGDAGVLPGAVRVEQLQANLGATVQPGGQVMSVTSTTPVVNVALDTSYESLVQVGDPVEITLPNGGKTTAGRIASIASSATSAQSPSPSTASSGSAAPSATVAVTISLDNPAATALDQAPVTVSITAASVKAALAVPIAALLAREQGGYAVEVAGPGDRTHLVSVQTGLFDDQDGLVQISGAGVTPGTRVVVPSVS